MMPTAFKQAFTVAAASLTGFASNVTGAAWVIATAGPADGLAHKVTIRNDAAVDHSAKTVTLTGTDANDNALTETLSLPGASATVTSTKFFKTLTSAAPSATIGADTMDIGWAAAAVSPWVKTDYIQSGFSVGVGVAIGGTINYDVEHTYDIPTGDAQAFKHAGITGATANDSDSYTAPIQALRVNVNSHTSGTFTLFALQGDRS